MDERGYSHTSVKRVSKPNSIWIPTPWPNAMRSLMASQKKGGRVSACFSRRWVVVETVGGLRSERIILHYSVTKDHPFLTSLET